MFISNFFHIKDKRKMFKRGKKNTREIQKYKTFKFHNPVINLTMAQKTSKQNNDKETKKQNRKLFSIFFLLLLYCESYKALVLLFTF